MRLAGWPALMRDPCHPSPQGGRGFGSSGWQPGLNFAAVLSGPGTVGAGLAAPAACIPGAGPSN